jgi:hypothetical protein
MLLSPNTLDRREAIVGLGLPEEVLSLAIVEMIVKTPENLPDALAKANAFVPLMSKGTYDASAAAAVFLSVQVLKYNFTRA